MHRMRKPMIIIKTKNLRMLRPRKRLHPRIRHLRILRPPQNNQPRRQHPRKQIRIHQPLTNRHRHRRHTRHIIPRRNNRRIQQRHMRHPNIIQRNRRRQIPTQRRPDKTHLTITLDRLSHPTQRITHIHILRPTLTIHQRHRLQRPLKKHRLLPRRRRMIAMQEVQHRTTFPGGQHRRTPDSGRSPPKPPQT